ncbi:acid phosphatase/Vanadium-dependent haloperoxidase [Trametes coccinea BRFM310]|uniref:Acid phosphatase/Vanadium-dependent haloperoxidase n=1 Tax=Trametes coccinea (strain BRFM310) TaxID=1353009 RepID=A0A1Y2IFN9_TRAC3|nr:acid phosphatase/Vanadium-dependent haloperoxidase [Trametes coccinea BRFM310]
MISERRRWKLVLSYAPDWLVCIVLALVFYALDYVDGFKREFSLTDTSYAVHERVPPVALYMICGVAPLVLQAVINVLSVRSWWDLHTSLLGLLLSLSLAGGITQFVKITVGRPRPDLIARCIPKAGAADPPLGLSTAAVCTQTVKHILQDGWRSFPSGHSSLSFAGLGFLSFYLAGKLHLFDNRGHTVKAWLSVTPLSGAALVAISRTMDYRHHWQDVLAGSLLGLATAYFSYRQYYPPLHSQLCHEPYPPRSTRGGQTLPIHTRDVSDTSVLAGIASNDREMRPHTERRYSDRPSMGDEEMALETATHPTTSTEDSSARKEPWREPSHGSL